MTSASKHSWFLSRHDIESSSKRAKLVAGHTSMKVGSSRKLVGHATNDCILERPWRLLQYSS